MHVTIVYRKNLGPVKKPIGGVQLAEVDAGPMYHLEAGQLLRFNDSLWKVRTAPEWGDWVVLVPSLSPSFEVL